MKNTLADLNNYLFEALERVNDDSLSDEELDREIKKSETVQRIANTVIDNASLSLKAQMYFDEYRFDENKNVNLTMIGVTDESKRR